MVRSLPRFIVLVGLLLFLVPIIHRTRGVNAKAVTIGGLTAPLETIITQADLKGGDNTLSVTIQPNAPNNGLSLRIENVSFATSGGQGRISITDLRLAPAGSIFSLINVAVRSRGVAGFGYITLSKLLLNSTGSTLRLRNVSVFDGLLQLSDVLRGALGGRLSMAFVTARGIAGDRIGYVANHTHLQWDQVNASYVDGLTLAGMLRGATSSSALFVRCVFQNVTMNTIAADGFDCHVDLRQSSFFGTTSDVLENMLQASVHSSAVVDDCEFWGWRPPRFGALSGLGIRSTNMSVTLRGIRRSGNLSLTDMCAYSAGCRLVVTGDIEECSECLKTALWAAVNGTAVIFAISRPRVDRAVANLFQNLAQMSIGSRVTMRNISDVSSFAGSICEDSFHCVVDIQQVRNVSFFSFGRLLTGASNGTALIQSINLTASGAFASTLVNGVNSHVSVRNASHLHEAFGFAGSQCENCTIQLSDATNLKQAFNPLIALQFGAEHPEIFASKTVTSEFIQLALRTENFSSWLGPMTLFDSGRVPDSMLVFYKNMTIFLSNIVDVDDSFPVYQTAPTAGNTTNLTYHIHNVTIIRRSFNMYDAYPDYSLVAIRVNVLINGAMDISDSFQLLGLGSAQRGTVIELRNIRGVSNSFLELGHGSTSGFSVVLENISLVTGISFDKVLMNAGSGSELNVTSATSLSGPCCYGWGVNAKKLQVRLVNV